MRNSDVYTLKSATKSTSLSRECSLQSCADPWQRDAATSKISARDEHALAFSCQAR
jgi:hypothetical protein